MNRGKNNISRKAVIFHILVIGWMIVIFCFSAQPGEESADISGSVSHLLVSLAEEIFDFDWNNEKVLEVATLIDYPVRKLAHMTEYGILALLSFGATGGYESLHKGKRRWLAALLISFLYATSDEIHQRFVPNRYGCFTDVLIDTAGAAIALCVLAIMITVIQKSKNRKKNNFK